MDKRIEGAMLDLLDAHPAKLRVAVSTQGMLADQFRAIVSI